MYEVCKDVLAFVMGQSESLDIICRPWAPEPVPEKQQDLPSWIPKLSSAPFELVDKVYKRVEADPLVGLPGMRRKNYLASGKRKAIWIQGRCRQKLVCLRLRLGQGQCEKRNCTARYHPGRMAQGGTMGPCKSSCTRSILAYTGCRSRT